MILIGSDFHPSWQQVCWLDTETGETDGQRVAHGPGGAEKFYRRFAAPALIGLEATMDRRCSEEIRASDVRQQKHDRRDAALLLRLLSEGRFPRIWTPSSEQRGHAAIVDSPAQPGVAAGASKE